MLRKLFMRRIITCYIIIIVAIIIDQTTKYLISSTMVLGQSIPIIEDVFHITYFRNAGAAFGILQGQTTLLTVLPIVLIIGILIFLTVKTKGSHFTLPLALVLICSGGIGNLIDRIRFGNVIDFFDFRVFPIFNVADSLVVIGCGLLLIHMFLFDKDEKAEEEEVEAEEMEAEEAKADAEDDD